MFLEMCQKVIFPGYPPAAHGTANFTSHSRSNLSATLYLYVKVYSPA